MCKWAIQNAKVSDMISTTVKIELGVASLSDDESKVNSMQRR